MLCDAELAALFDLKVYIDTPDDIRFIRRLMRDQNERGRSVESIVRQYLRFVRPAQERLTGPSRAKADIVLTDASLSIDRPNPDEVAQLAAPLLRHPLIAPFVQG